MIQTTTSDKNKQLLEPNTVSELNKFDRHRCSSLCTSYRGSHTNKMRWTVSTLCVLWIVIANLSTFTAAQGCNCVAFRLDDIQDFYLAKVQEEIIKAFQEEGLPLTIGIIGGAGKFGNHRQLVDFLKTAMADPNWELEIASHGNQHENFSSLTADEQRTRLRESNHNTKAVLGISHIPTFIPPFNEFNQYTIPVLKELGFTHMTSQVQLDPPPYPLSGQTFYRFPINASTNLLEFTPWFMPMPASYTMDRIHQQLSEFGFAGVMMHPQEFAMRDDATGILSDEVNQTQFQELKSVLQQVKSEGLKVVPFGRLNLDAPNVTLTETVPTGGVTGISTGGDGFHACNCVAFRLEDIQDYYLRNGYLAIMDVFQRANASLDLVIIGNYFRDDRGLINRIQEALDDEAWDVELACGGWNHEDFTSLTYLEARALLLNCSTHLYSIFNETTKVFSPPFSAYNADTVNAMSALGYTHLTSREGFELPPYNTFDSYGYPVGGVWKFPAGSASSDWLTGQYGVSHRVMWEQIQLQHARFGFAVGYFQAQEFLEKNGTEYTTTVNQTMVEELEALIEVVRSNGLRIVLLTEIDELLYPPSLTTGLESDIFVSVAAPLPHLSLILLVFFALWMIVAF